jgi:hypothetical protein
MLVNSGGPRFEHDAGDVSVPSADAVSDDYHAYRHCENLERLAGSAGE